MWMIWQAMTVIEIFPSLIEVVIVTEMNRGIGYK